jgi:hypothetical protein
VAEVGKSEIAGVFELINISSTNKLEQSSYIFPAFTLSHDSHHLDVKLDTKLEGFEKD